MASISRTVVFIAEKLKGEMCNRILSCQEQHVLRQSLSLLFAARGFFIFKAVPILYNVNYTVTILISSLSYNGQGVMLLRSEWSFHKFAFYGTINRAKYSLK